MLAFLRTSRNLIRGSFSTLFAILQRVQKDSSAVISNHRDLSWAPLQEIVSKADGQLLLRIGSGFDCW